VSTFSDLTLRVWFVNFRAGPARFSKQLSPEVAASALQSPARLGVGLVESTPVIPLQTDSSKCESFDYVDKLAEES
jgi:hypothetical protein